MKKKPTIMTNSGPATDNHGKLDKDVKEFIKVCSQRPDPYIATWANDLLRRDR
jgi:hypothetical protein